jgi:hypothetical protein
MASENTFRISVSASFSDASGGDAYAFAVPTESISDTVEIINKIKSKDLTDSKMLSLGAFEAGGVPTPLSGNIEVFLDWADPTLGTSTLIGGGSYDVYVYAIDPFKNRVVQKHPQSPVTMTTETIVLAWPTATMFIGGLTESSNKFAEHRDIYTTPSINVTSGSTFDFYEPSHRDALYVIDPVLNNADYQTLDPTSPAEYLVDSVKVVALLSTNSETDLAIVEHANGIHGINVNAFDSGNNYQIANIADTGLGIVYGTEYKVYAVIHAVGFDKTYVEIIDTVFAGKPPVLSDLNVEIVEIPPA